MSMRRTLCLKPCACLLANQAYEDPECDGKVATCWNHANAGSQTWGRFLQPLCSSVVLGSPMPLIMHAGGLDGASKAANLSSTLIISCASSAQRIFPFLSRKTCGEDVASVGDRISMILGAPILLLSRRRLRSDGRWSLGHEQ